MNLCNIFSLAVLFSLSTVALASYNKARAQGLVDLIDSPLKDGNEAIIQEAIDKMDTEYPECQPNICFALDGSGSISANEFDLQKGFVLLATAVLGGIFDPSGQYAAVEYGSVIDVISPLTTNLDTPTTGFLFRVNDATSQNAPFTFVAPGLQYCISQFNRSPQKLNKIVLLGDGASNFGDTGRFGAPRIARRFRRNPKNSICAGIVGGGSRDFFERITGDPNLVLRTPNWETIIDIIIDLVDGICGIPE